MTTLADLANKPAIRRENPKLFGMSSDPVKRSVKLERFVGKDLLNKTEREAFGILQRQHAGAIILTQAIKFRIGLERCWYTPDFVAVYHEPLRVIVIEVKGAFFRDDARVKFQAAKLMYPFLKWRWMQKTKEGWREE